MKISKFNKHVVVHWQIIYTEAHKKSKEDVAWTLVVVIVVVVVALFQMVRHHDVVAS